MLERFIDKTTFESQEDFIKNFKIKVPENFNFGYDVVDAWAEEEPDKKALCWTNDHGEHIDFTFADLKRYTDQTASYFQSLGIGHGDMVMLILKRRYEFWFSIIALHKLGAVVIPATHLLTKKDIVYRANAADIKMIVCAGEEVITKHIIEALPDSPQGLSARARARACGGPGGACASGAVRLVSTGTRTPYGACRGAVTS